MGKEHGSGKKGIFRDIFERRSRTGPEKKANDTILTKVTKEPSGTVTVSDQFGNKFSSIPELCKFHGMKCEYFREVQPGFSLKN